MAKFNVGDRVRLARTDGDDNQLVAGMVGTVAEKSRTPFVDWDGLTTGNGPRGCRWAVNEGQIELARAASGDVLAVLIAAGLVTQAQVDAANALIAEAA